MRRLILVFLCLCSAIGWASERRVVRDVPQTGPKWMFNFLPRSMQRRPNVEFWIVTEHTPRGLELPTPTPRVPLHFVSATGGYHVAGEHVGERAPTAAGVDRVLHSVLEAQGMVAADAAHPARVLLVYTWGSHHREMIPGAIISHHVPQAWDNYDRNPLGSSSYGNANYVYIDNEARALMGMQPTFDYRPLPMPVMDVVEWEPDRPAAMRKADLIERAALLVGDAFARNLRATLSFTPEDAMNRGPAMSTLTRAARLHPRGEFLLRTMDQSLYFVAVTAYDVAGVARGRRDVLWRTKIAIAADGVSLVETMPAMLVAAGPHFGRPSAEAALVERRLDRRGNIVIGDAEVIGWEAGGEPAPVKRAEARR